MTIRKSNKKEDEEISSYEFIGSPFQGKGLEAMKLEAAKKKLAKLHFLSKKTIHKILKKYYKELGRDEVSDKSVKT